MSKQVVVEVNEVIKSFGRGEERSYALKKASMQAYAGELLMLVGPSGCGKTTLLSVIAGTLDIDEGDIVVYGSCLENMSRSNKTLFRKKNIGFIFQAYNLIPALTTVENVSVPLLINGTPRRQAEERAREMLAKVGLGDKFKSLPSQLSGGQQQRVAIARALVHEPNLVICDEPTAALDSETGQKVMELLREVARDPKRCVLVVTHDNRIFKFADRIIRMEDGAIHSEFEEDFHNISLH